jgi:hypothetical protein
VKPDWKDAPEWAMWLAQDEDGDWFWYENKPVRVGGVWGAVGGRSQFVRGTLSNEPEPRP